MRFELGIDEAGRGPLAGPVAIGAVLIKKEFDWNLLPGVNDSKQLSAKKRAELFKITKDLSKQGKLSYTVTLVGPQLIDKDGISQCLKLAIRRAIKKLNPGVNNCFIKLDGSLYAPAHFNQETIIKGDQTEKVISLASIIAKETRDAYMIKKSLEEPFSLYDFDLHKGYGTRLHREKIKRYGLTALHRRTYCNSCLKQ